MRIKAEAFPQGCQEPQAPSPAPLPTSKSPGAACSNLACTNLVLNEGDEEVQTIGQIELCLTKQDQKLRNCTELGQEPPHKKEVWLAGGGTESRGLRVCEDGPVFYPPPKKAKY
ncbi:hypothetical protein P7K49_008973 [Saguinus oedipus]|uniref:Uncharacterized protein n=1 Tax=Saguinus oedipus TaxID=9490 RepID=A0ABQ9VZ89_SAGOE|nr:hypothetical protein P7K49_008973 [Saguinus oedipus]